MKRSGKVAVLGAGSWGSALGLHIAQKFETTLWSHNADQAMRMQQNRVNERYLPKNPFPPQLSVTSFLAEGLKGASIILLAVPSTALKSLLSEIKKITPNPPPIINATKGLDHENNRFFSTIIDELFDFPIQATLSGPSFAKEVANNLPTAITIASNKLEHAQFFMPYFHHHSLRTYINLDPIGVQLAGAYKNIIAIATGISDGLGLGSNARAALITRGLSEMSRLGIALGGKLETFIGLAGVGDLVLTATDKQSRNYSFGFYLGQGCDKEQAFIKVGQVVEGANTAPNIYRLGVDHNIELPIVEEVYNILHNNLSPTASLSNLLARSVKVES